jgi:hypothetical protein
MRILYDVSGIHEWTGNFTGIQRVAYNLAKELHESGATAEYFVYSHGAFRVISFGDLEARVQGRLGLSNAKPSAQRASLRTVHHHVMVGAKRSVRGTKLEQPMRVAYGNLRNVYRSSRRFRQKTATQLASLPFKPEDIVVVVDGNWQFSGFDEAIVTAKSKIGFKLVHFVQDLTAVRNPALVNKGAKKIIGSYFENIFPAADLLLAISQSTKRDIEWYADQLGMQLPRSEVIILGDNSVSKSSNQPVANNYSIEQPFVLVVGTIEIRKNYTALYYAYKLAHQKSIELPHLVIVGHRGWMADEVYELLTKDTDLASKISILQNVNDAELERFYENCLFTIFPSFYEGWGLPVAESFAHGKLCVSSNTSSMPEVGGDLATYVSPYNPSELMERIKQLSSDPSRLKKMEAKIAASYEPRLWKDTYKDMINMFTHLP